MTSVLDVVGLLALIAAAFLVDPALGLFVLGLACLLLSFKLTRRSRGGGS